MAKADKSASSKNNKAAKAAQAAAQTAPEAGPGPETPAAPEPVAEGTDAIVAGSSRFQPVDKLAGLVLMLVSLILYVVTLQPSTGLEDAGEFITASDHFGVPHPPGYPLWSLCTFLLAHILPLGNIAWRVNLFSALCGAAAVGMFTMLASHAVRWMLQSIRGVEATVARRFALIGAVTGGLVLAFSDVMWSQAVIAEVYCLNAVFLAMLLICFYKWMHDPTRTGWLVATAFSLALGMTNHHTLLFVCPAFILGVWLVAKHDGRLDIFRDFMVALALTCTTVTAMFGWLSGQPDFQATCGRLIVIGLGFSALVSVWWNAKRQMNHALAVTAGVLVFGGLGWASVTDKPAPGVVPTINAGFEGIALLVLLLTAAAGVGLGLGYLRAAGATTRQKVWGALLALGGVGLVVISQLTWFTDTPVSLMDHPFVLLAVAGFIALCVVGEFGRQFNWRLVASIVGVTWCGLVFYGYMQVASSTNPPMNWGYASERQGLFHAINRGQYSDNMVVVLQHYIAPMVGLPKGDKPQQGDTGDLKGAAAVANQVKLYWLNLVDNMSWLVAVLPLGMLLHVGSFRPRINHWMVFLIAAFFMLTVLLFILMNPGLDKQSQWVNKTFTLQSHSIFSLFVAGGVACLLLFLKETLSGVPIQALGWLFPLVSLLPFKDNYDIAEQRDRWFGWMYGVDMLRDMEPDAVVFGGTDPGRFVPTFTIFCESTQDDHWKPWMGEPGDGPLFGKNDWLARLLPGAGGATGEPVNPKYPKKFDRRDLYIITQNALADQTYMKYIRSHYDRDTRAKDMAKRGGSWNWFEKWLGRETIYPKDPLILPTEAEVNQAFAQYVQMSGQNSGPGGRVVVQGIQGVFAINGLISKMIFDKNKDKHAFYVEESFPMDWYYPHAEPFGLCLKINKEPLSRITPEMMAKDRQYWDTYTAKLTNQWRYGPNNSRSKFLEDRPANMSYSKLRLSVANIYSWRAIQPVTSPEDRTALFAEAEYAYRQALAMAPSNSEAAFRLADMLINLGRFDDSKKVLAAFAKEDPHNPQTPRLEAEVDRRRQLYEERMRLEPAVRSGQAGLPDKLRLMQVCQQMNDRGAVLVLADMVIADPALTADVARQLAGFFFQGQMYDKTVNLLQRLVQLAPTDPQVPRMFLDIAALQVMLGQSKEAVSSLQRAVKQGGEPIRQAAVADQRLGAIRGLPEVQRLLGQPAMPPAGGADVFGLPAFSPAAPGGAPAPAPGK